MSRYTKQDVNDFAVMAALLLCPIVLFAFISIMEHYEVGSENSDNIENITVNESENNQSQFLNFSPLKDDTSF